MQPRGSPLGPMAVPGDYLVRLTVDGRRLEQHLTLRPDPRVHVSTQELQQQLELANTVAGLLTRSSRDLLEAQSQQNQLAAIKTSGAAEQAVRDFGQKLTDILRAPAGKTEDRRSCCPMCKRKSSTLYKSSHGWRSSPNGRRDSRSPAAAGDSRHAGTTMASNCKPACRS